MITVTRVFTCLILLASLIIYLADAAGAMAAEDSRPRDNEVNNAAYQMGVKIQDAVRSQSLEKIAMLFNYYGTQHKNGLPSLEDVEGKPFNDVLPVNWKNNILSVPPKCEPVGSHEYMLDNGNLLYDREGIIQLPGIRFVEPTFKIGWTYKKYGLTPSCLIRVWAGYNNYQEIHERFINDELASLRKFIEHPGLFLGKSPPFHPIPAWDWDNINIVRQ